MRKILLQAQSLRWFVVTEKFIDSVYLETSKVAWYL